MRKASKHHHILLTTLWPIGMHLHICRGYMSLGFDPQHLHLGLKIKITNHAC